MLINLSRTVRKVEVEAWQTEIRFVGTSHGIISVDGSTRIVSSEKIADLLQGKRVLLCCSSFYGSLYATV
jgi:hypothetical protein